MAEDGEECAWKSSFKGFENRYFGYVLSVEAAVDVVKQFEVETSTEFSVFKTVEDFGFGDPFGKQKEIHFATERIPFDGVPFNVLGSKVLNCEHSPDHKIARKSKQFEDSSSKRGKATPKMSKFECPAKIQLTEVVRFTDYKIKHNTYKGRQSMSSKLKAAIKAGKKPETERRIYVQLPNQVEHEGHVTGEKGRRKNQRKRQAAEELDSEILTKKCDYDSSNQASYSVLEEAFRSLLHASNLTPSKFFTEYWEKKPLIISRNEPSITEQYSQLFSLDILKKIVKETELKFVQDLSVCRYVNGSRENLNGKGVVKVTNLEKLVSKKSATIQFHQPQRFQDNLWKMCSSLECYFQCLVGANVYITPGGSQGLAPHYDDVEVFILQLEGEKHWRLYELPLDERLPRDYSRDLDPASLGTPTHDFVLKAGDLMYFPRGTIHQADTPEHCPHSTHITISTYQHNTWGDLLKMSLPSVVDQMMNQEKSLRTGLPVTPGQTFDVTKYKDHITLLLKQLADGFNSSTLHEMQIDFIANRLPPYHASPEELDSSGSIPTVSDVVRLRFPEYTTIFEETSTWKEGDDEDEDENEPEENDRTKYVYLYHSLQNNRSQHMMSAEDSQPTGLKYQHDHLQALRKLKKADRDVGISAKSLDLSESDKLSMLVSMWSEGLLEVVGSSC